MIPDIAIFSSPQDLFRDAAQQFVHLANEAIRTKGSFTVALSGGSTPRGMHGFLATEFSSKVAWDKVFFFWGDERHVGPDDPESNYRMAEETLLSKVSVDRGKIFRVHSENPDANAAAVQYEQTLTTAFRIQDLGVPRFDLILLGLGPDGHCASLFPHTAALKERSRLVVFNWVERFKTDRITFTVPLIDNAANIIFLVAGQDKAAAVESVFNPDSKADDFPAKLVQPRNGRILWMLTEDAAARIADRIGVAQAKNSQR